MNRCVQNRHFVLSHHCKMGERSKRDKNSCDSFRMITQTWVTSIAPCSQCLVILSLLSLVRLLRHDISLSLTIVISYAKKLFKNGFFSEWLCRPDVDTTWLPLFTSIANCYKSSIHFDREIQSIVSNRSEPERHATMKKRQPTKLTQIYFCSAIRFNSIVSHIKVVCFLPNTNSFRRGQKKTSCAKAHTHRRKNVNMKNIES